MAAPPPAAPSPGPSAAPATGAAPAPPTTWADVLAGLLRGQDLPRATAAWAMGQVMAGDATPVQVAGFLVALRAKGETAEEVGGLVDAMLDAAVRVELAEPSLDVVGTGGDRAGTVNISTMAALVAAAAGARVVKHGNRAASSRTGTADVLERLGVAVALGPAGVAACADRLGIAFCFAPTYHPAMRHAAVPRRELGVPTVFNVLGPLANPASPAAALVGCADPRLAPVMADVLAARGVRALVVRGDDGLDEITTCSTTRVWDCTGGPVRPEVLDPAALGVPPAPPAALRGGEPDLNAAVAAAVLAGSREGTYAAVSDAVALNAAAALVAWDAATGAGAYGAAGGPLADRVGRALGVARRVLDQGRAGLLLERWAELSTLLAAAG